MKSGIYRILNLANGKSYIGQTVDLDDRLYKHLVLLRVGTHCNLHLQASFKKYGEASFEFRTLEHVDESMLDEREKSWIAYYKSDDRQFGYNSDGGGKGNRIVSVECRAKIAAALTGRKASEETKKKMSASQRGKPNRLSPEDYARGVATRRANGGYIVSEETKRRRRETCERKRLGKTDDASGPMQVEMKIEQPVKDQPVDPCVAKFVPFCQPTDRFLPCPPRQAKRIRKLMSAEARANMRLAKLNQSPETRAKISAGNRGKVRSPEMRLKYSLAKTGKTINLSPEGRTRKSVAMKAYWAAYRLNRKNNQENKKETIVLGA